MFALVKHGALTMEIMGLFSSEEDALKEARLIGKELAYSLKSIRNYGELLGMVIITEYEDAGDETDEPDEKVLYTLCVEKLED